MSVLGSVGKDAAQELHKTVTESIPQAQAAVDEIITRTANEIVTQAAGALTQAAGSLEIALGGLPESIVMALDGLTVEVSAITVKVSRGK